MLVELARVDQWSFLLRPWPWRRPACLGDGLGIERFFRWTGEGVPGGIAVHEGWFDTHLESRINGEEEVWRIFLDDWKRTAGRRRGLGQEKNVQGLFCLRIGRLIMQDNLKAGALLLLGNNQVR